MFDLGMQELIVIFAVALLVFGPQRLPELARSLGKGMAELRKTLHGVKDQIDSEVDQIEKPLREEIQKIAEETKITEEEILADIAKAEEEITTGEEKGKNAKGEDA
jgi:Tat protein translocase TatB subunit